MSHKAWWVVLIIVILGGVAWYFLDAQSPEPAVQTPTLDLTTGQQDQTPPTQPTSPTPAATTTADAPPPSTASRPTFTKPFPMTIDTTKQYTAVLHTTDGDITIAFNKGSTPITVNNFVSLAKANFYNNTIFHRVIKGFMIQGGDPLGNGTGGPGYQFNDEPFTGTYTRGTVAMANAGPNTNGSQFFIMQADNQLPPNYVIFGHVTVGMDVVDKIANAPVTMSPSGEDSEPVSPVTVKSVTISEK